MKIAPRTKYSLTDKHTYKHAHQRMYSNDSQRQVNMAHASRTFHDMLQHKFC